MAASPDLKLFGMWASPYVHRVQLALKLKGVEYEYVEENLLNKSPELLKYNPIYTKVPVLLHDGRPLVESFIILEYIDQAWSGAYPLIPKDPYERAVVRFWHHFQADKMAPLISRIFRTAGEDQEAAVMDFRATLKHVEDEMQDGFFKGRRFFGGDRIGALDILYGCGSVWFFALEEITAGSKLVDPEAFPRLWAWIHDFNEQELVKDIIPPKEKLVGHARSVRARVFPNLVA